MDGPVSMRLLPTKAVSKRGVGSREALEDGVERGSREGAGERQRGEEGARQRGFRGAGAVVVREARELGWAGLGRARLTSTIGRESAQRKTAPQRLCGRAASGWGLGRGGGGMREAQRGCRPEKQQRSLAEQAGWGEDGWCSGCVVL